MRRCMKMLILEILVPAFILHATVVGAEDNVDGALSFITSPSDRLVQFGKSTSLSCSIRKHASALLWSRGGLHTHWYHGDKEIKSRSDIYSFKQGGSQLEIKQVKFNETGTYHCVARSKVGAVRSTKAHVKISDSVESLSISPARQEWPRNSTTGQPPCGVASIHCTAVHSSHTLWPTIFWQVMMSNGQWHNLRPTIFSSSVKPGYIILDNPDKSTLQIQCPFRKETASSAFRCYVESSSQQRKIFSDVATIKQSDKLPQDVQKTSFSTQTETITISEGSRILLSCPVTHWPECASLSHTPVKWYTRPSLSTLIRANPRFLRGASNFAVVPAQNTSYTCVAGINCLTEKSRDINVIVLKSPEFVTPLPRTSSHKVGKMLRLSCKATGHPTPHIHWLLNAERIVRDPLKNFSQDDNLTIYHRGPGESELKISLPQEHRAMVQCEAVNSAGHSESTTLVTAISVRIINHPRNTTVYKGQSAFKLSCEADGFPNQLRYYWFHNRTLIRNISRFSVLQDGSLKVKHVHHEDSGSYKCIVFNGQAQPAVSRTATLHVIQGTESATEKPAISVSSSGKNIRMTTNHPTTATKATESVSSPGVERDSPAPDVEDMVGVGGREQVTAQRSADYQLVLILVMAFVVFTVVTVALTVGLRRYVRQQSQQKSYKVHHSSLSRLVEQRGETPYAVQPTMARWLRQRDSPPNQLRGRLSTRSGEHPWMKQVAMMAVSHGNGAQSQLVPLNRRMSDALYSNSDLHCSGSPDQCSRSLDRASLMNNPNYGKPLPISPAYCNTGGSTFFFAPNLDTSCEYLDNNDDSYEDMRPVGYNSDLSSVHTPTPSPPHICTNPSQTSTPERLNGYTQLPAGAPERLDDITPPQVMTLEMLAGYSQSSQFSVPEGLENHAQALMSDELDTDSFFQLMSASPAASRDSSLRTTRTISTALSCRSVQHAEMQDQLDVMLNEMNSLAKSFDANIQEMPSSPEPGESPSTSPDDNLDSPLRL